VAWWGGGGGCGGGGGGSPTLIIPVCVEMSLSLRTMNTIDTALLIFWPSALRLIAEERASQLFIKILHQAFPLHMRILQAQTGGNDLERG